MTGNYGDIKEHSLLVGDNNLMNGVENESNASFEMETIEITIEDKGTDVDSKQPMAEEKMKIGKPRKPYLCWTANFVVQGGMERLEHVLELNEGGINVEVANLWKDACLKRVLAKEAYEDFQLIIWYDRLPRHSNLLLILMRTPINADMFSKPPKVAPTIHISWLTFPMAKIFLECVAKAHCSIEFEFDNLKGNPQGR
ncbi:hypothetical protein Godav_002162 [Gossypium davidsonii]|uniref:Uncharacterized protein n=2 Tax=Gossypium TaxID=3633 RepID=A0A7J8SVA2_GOSDV|nr:hypothetical protein [Gossypium davidsonii]MBA0665727.1 hypothetical protein [Gossypium klotzschianum]